MKWICPPHQVDYSSRSIVFLILIKWLFRFKFCPNKDTTGSLQKLLSFRYQKPNQMAKRSLNFEAGNGNWWGPRNHERKLLIGPEHTLHWIHWRISCSCVRKYGWKTVESRCNLVWVFDSVFWRELVVSLQSLPQLRGASKIFPCSTTSNMVIY